MPAIVPKVAVRKLIGSLSSLMIVWEHAFVRSRIALIQDLDSFRRAATVNILLLRRVIVGIIPFAAVVCFGHVPGQGLNFGHRFSPWTEKVPGLVGF
jgi:hypothetical protein